MTAWVLAAAIVAQTQTSTVVPERFQLALRTCLEDRNQCCAERDEWVAYAGHLEQALVEPALTDPPQPVLPWIVAGLGVAAGLAGVIVGATQ